MRKLRFFLIASVAALSFNSFSQTEKDTIHIYIHPETGIEFTIKDGDSIAVVDAMP